MIVEYHTKRNGHHGIYVDSGNYFMYVDNDSDGDGDIRGKYKSYNMLIMNCMLIRFLECI